MKRAFYFNQDNKKQAMLISTDQLNASEKRFKEWKAKQKLKKASGSKIKSFRQSDKIISSAENLVKRKAMLRSVAVEPFEFAFERAIGNNDSVYSNFCELISLAKQKVGRIVIRRGNTNLGYATGFMVSENLLLTNWHVFKKAEDAVDSEIQFFYEYDLFCRPGQAIVFKLSPQEFYFSNQNLDYCFVAVKETDISEKVKLSEIGYHYLDPNTGKIGKEGVELLNIIHHPDGDFKQLSIRENRFLKILENTLWYETDTAPGSSGSPVFNDQWQIVGLHHMGVPAKTSNGKNYVDKNGKIILPDESGHIDSSKIYWIANEGIRISVILEDIKKQFPDSAIVKGLAVAPPDNLRPYKSAESVNYTNSTSQKKNNPTMETTNSNNINISIPASLLQAEGNVTININSNAAGAIINRASNPKKNKLEDLLIEEKRIDKESSVDFDKCDGYKTNFLGVEIKMPQPLKAIEKQIARLKDKSIELKYFNYSVIFNSVRKMPLISAINVEGDESKRLDNSKRSDDWLRDKRISLDVQLKDDFYLASGFDKGHMSRFEDANWALDSDSKLREENAKRNGVYTCFYSNACPQVDALNRAGGMWGHLEKSILEKGVKKEAGKLARVTVFNGPIFSPEKDRIFKGVKIPMEFFKIVLWLNNSNKLKATAFKLSQEKLVKEIKFQEAEGFLEESLDIDRNEEYLEFQCSISSLSKLTKIDFSGIQKYDTYKSVKGNETTPLKEHELAALIDKHKKS
jgi:endonuclease G